MQAPRVVLTAEDDEGHAMLIQQTYEANRRLGLFLMLMLVPPVNGQSARA